MSIREEFERQCATATGPTGNESETCYCGGGCESVLECEFWYYLRKTPEGESRAIRQFNIGKFRVDSLIECGGDLVVVELDGKEFHQDKRADFQRDTELLKTVDAVIRVPYAAMHFYPMATFRVLSIWYPRFAFRFKDLWCIPFAELTSEINKSQPIMGKFDLRDWLKQNEHRYEVWRECSDSVSGGFGIVGSARAFLEHHDSTPISLRRRSGEVNNQ